LYLTGVSQATQFNNDYSNYIVSDAIPVGTSLRKTTFQHIEFKMARYLESDEGVQLSYMTSANPLGSYSLIGECLSSTIPTNGLSFEFNPNIENAEWVKIKAALKGPASTSSLLPLKEIRII